jgi:hypothetical protein
MVRKRTTARRRLTERPGFCRRLAPQPLIAAAAAFPLRASAAACCNRSMRRSSSRRCIRRLCRASGNPTLDALPSSNSSQTSA